MNLYVIIFVVVIILYIMYKYGSRKNAVESDRVFYKFADDFSLQAPQQDRIRRSINDGLLVKSSSKDKFTGVVSGSSGKLYVVSLLECNCPDFKDRKKPCKHMYCFAVRTGRAALEEKDGVYHIKRK